MDQTKNEEIKSGLDVKKVPSDKLAIFITDTLGSLVFLTVSLLFFSAWISWNLGLLPGLTPFEHYPFPGLEMVVSVFAIFLSVSVLMSQNRQNRIEKLRQQVEFEVNVRAEHEITKVLQMLHEIQIKMGIDKQDSELENMKEVIDLQQLHEQMEHTEVSKDI